VVVLLLNELKEFEMIRSLGTRLIIKQVKVGGETTSDSGIILSTNNNNTTLGEIVSIGLDAGDKWQIGQHIVPNWNKVEHLRIDGVDLFSIEVKDILGVIA
jgi:co-chaperonin GroES (HSP10)